MTQRGRGRKRYYDEFQTGDKVLVEAIVKKTYGDGFPVIEIPETNTPICVEQSKLRRVELLARTRKGR